MQFDSGAIQTALDKYSRVELTRTPTPLDYLPTLSQQLDINLYLKRDDLTDLAFGGDKPRKLEYELVQAVELKADTLVTCGSMQSNHARLTTAAARKLGMDCVVVLSHDQYEQIQGNLLTVYLMGARVEVIRDVDHWDLEKYGHAICDDLRASGKTPYYVPVSGSTPRSSLGYVRGALELLAQLPEQGRELDAVYTPFGTGGTFTAMMLTFRQLGIECPFFGISVNRKEPTCHENLNHWWTELCKLLSLDPARSKGSYELHDEFIGPDYGYPTEAGLDAIMRMASTEGILLDPVYSGKVFSGLLAHVNEGRWPSDSTILMLHSGGTPALFAYHEVIETHLRKRGIRGEDVRGVVQPDKPLQTKLDAREAYTDALMEKYT
ncbi:MAG: D-cysteine desulfhydrase family protein [Chloroflexota bacterium]